MGFTEEILPRKIRSPLAVKLAVAPTVVAVYRRGLKPVEAGKAYKAVRARSV